MSFTTNKKILRMASLSNQIVSYGSAIAIATYGDFTISAIIVGSALGGWSLANGGLGRRLARLLPEDADAKSLWRIHAERTTRSELD